MRLDVCVQCVCTCVYGVGMSLCVCVCVSVYTVVPPVTIYRQFIEKNGKFNSNVQLPLSSSEFPSFLPTNEKLILPAVS